MLRRFQAQFRDANTIIVGCSRGTLWNWTLRPFSKCFLYDPNTLNQFDGALNFMANKKGYNCVALTNNANQFWNTVNGLEQNSVLVVLSHGSNDGFLPIAGDEGDDANLDTFIQSINNSNTTLYLLSCHTGNNPCGAKLTNGFNVSFVAPKGYAKLKAGSDYMAVTSIVDPKFPEKFAGWIGTQELKPRRDSIPIKLP